MAGGWYPVQAFNGAGDTKTPTKINLVFFWFIQIPLSYFLAIKLGWQHSGVFWGVFISETSVGLVYAVVVFKREDGRLQRFEATSFNVLEADWN